MSTPEIAQSTSQERSLALLDRLTFSGEVAQGIQMADLLSDQRAVHAFHDLSVQRNRFYNNVVRFILKSGRQQLCAMLDFDVIYAYVMGGMAGAASEAEVDYFFNSSQIDYAIPIGAFIEMQHFIEKNLPLAAVNRNLRDVHTLDDFSAVLEAEVDQRSGAASSQFFVDSIRERAARLLDILTSDRCKGVVTDYNRELKEVIQDKLDAMQDDRRLRRGIFRGERSENNARDAENLAIAASQYVATDGSASVEPQYVLLTGTTNIHRVANSLGMKPWLSISPRILAIADLLEVDSKPRIALQIARAVSESWSRLETLLYTTCRDFHNADTHDTDFPAIATEIRAVIAKLLEREQAVRIEKAACQLPSVQRLQDSQYMPQTLASQIDVEQASSRRECLRVLDALRGALSEVDSIEQRYRIIAKPTETVHRTFGIKSEEEGFGNDEFLSIEVLRTSRGNSGVWARWPICCGDERLVSCLSAFVDISLLGFDGDYSPGASPILIDEEGYNRIGTQPGIVVSTSICSIWLGYPWLTANGGWSMLHLAKLHGRLVEYASQRGPGWQGADELIQELSIRLPMCRVVYEVVPKDNSVGRQISCFSESCGSDSSDMISHFYDWTGMRFAFRKRLARTILDILTSDRNSEV